MDFIRIGDHLKSGLTQGWLKVAFGYQSAIIPPVRVAFNAISRMTGPIGAHVTLGAAAIGLFYLGRSVWNMKMGTFVQNQPDAEAAIVKRGPNTRLLQLMMRIAGLFEMLLAATIAGGLIAIAGGSTPLAIGVTSGIALLGMFV